MRKKTFLSIIMAIGICVSMTGCGSTSNGAADAPSAKEGKVKELKATDEILEADIYSQKVQLGNQVVTFPVTLDELISIGAEVENDINPINYILEPGYSNTAELNIDGWTYILWFHNYTDKMEGQERQRLQFKDCISDCTYAYKLISSDSFDTYMECNDNIIFPKGVKSGMSVDELKSAWGEPDSEDLDELIYKKSDMNYCIKIDLEKQVISTIQGNYSLKNN